MPQTLQLSGFKLVGGSDLGKNRHGGYINLRIENQNVPMLVDTGSSCSIISYSQFVHFFPCIQLTKIGLPRLTAVNGSNIVCKGVTTLTVHLINRSVSQEFLVAETHISVVGWDFLSTHEVVVQPHLGTLTIAGTVEAYLAPYDSSWGSTNMVTRNNRRTEWERQQVKKESRGIKMISRTPLTHPHLKDVSRTKPIDHSIELENVRFVGNKEQARNQPQQSQDIRVLEKYGVQRYTAVNDSGYITKGEKHIQGPVKQCEAIIASNELQPMAGNSSSDKRDDIVTTNERQTDTCDQPVYPDYNRTPQKLIKMLDPICRRFPRVFAQTIHPLSQHNFEVKINLTQRPKMIKPYRVALPYQKVIGDRFQELLKLGVVERSSSATVSPLVVTKKENGDLRPCVDFRGINEVTIPDVYPLPRMQDLLQSIKGVIFTKLDLRDAYYQVKVEAESIPLTAVNTPIGMVQFKRMPFGLRNASACFQRFIDHVFNDCHFVKCYLDDIVIFSETETEHMNHVEQALSRLDDFGLVINGNKSHFAVPNIIFLGFEIDQWEYRPASKNLPKFQRLKTPKNRKELQSILGVINFYRGHVPKIASILGPIYKLLSPKENFVWGSEQDKALGEVKTILEERRPLAQVTYTAPFILHTDASEEAVGAVLIQEDRPVGYFSKQLSACEKRYSTFDREALAIVRALKHFKGWIMGQNITVFSDHKPLVNWNTNKAASDRQARFQVAVQDFDFVVKYIPGIDNGLADLLSRPGIHTQQNNGECSAILHGQETGFAQFQDENGKNWDINKIKALQTDTMIDQYKANKVNVECIEGLWCEVSMGTPRVIIPEEIQTALVGFVHRLAHTGMNRTWNLIRSKYFWKGMHKKVKEIVKECPDCQQNKTSRKISRPPINFPVSDRFQHVHIDLVGPMGMSSEGNTYMLTMLDRHTRWLEAVPMSNISAEHCARVFLMQWVARFGVPEILTSDQGKQFDGHLFSSLMKMLGVQKIRTTAYHPQANGILERQHRTIKDALRCLSGTYEDWELALPLVLLGLRSAIHAHGYAPATLVFGEELVLPVDLVVAASRVKMIDNCQIVRSIRLLMLNIKQQLFEENPVSPDITWNNLVPTKSWVWLEAIPLQPCLSPKYKGPYQVVKCDAAVVTIMKDNKETAVSIDRVRRAWGMGEHAEEMEEDEDSETSEEDEMPNNRLTGIGRNRQTRSGRISKVPIRYSGSSYV